MLLDFQFWVEGGGVNFSFGHYCELKIADFFLADAQEVWDNATETYNISETPLEACHSVDRYIP